MNTYTFASSFWDVLWTALMIFIFIAWLMVLFTVLTDLFRDQKLNGWAKAVWVLFLVFVPALTTLVYLIARGRGMAERAEAAAKQQRAATEDYIRSVAAITPVEQVEHAKTLLDAGAITPAEFEQLKAMALG